MEINNFKTFEEFKIYLKNNKDKIPHWSEEEISAFNQKVYELQEKSPEFKEKYQRLKSYKLTLKFDKNCKLNYLDNKTFIAE